jgi:hypothetical protein
MKGKYCVLTYENGKSRPDEIIPGMGREGIKENDGGMNSTMIYCVRSSVNVTMFPQYKNNIMIKKEEKK